MGNGFLDERDLCGTAACAAGHATALFDPEKDETWHEYIERVFGIKSKFVANREWYWLFSSVWKNIDNTPTGAALRILYMLDNGVPASFGEYIGSQRVRYQYIEGHKLYRSEYDIVEE